MSDHKTRVLIIGSGPAGYTAAIYAARAGLEPILVQGTQPGGQLMITTDVENYPGFSEVIQGPWLMDQMKDQAANVGTRLFYDMIKQIDFEGRPFKAIGESGDVFVADTIILATGAQAKWLGIPSEEYFRGYGVSGCATCDGFFFKNKKVAIIGGGNTAVEEALFMTRHASEVYLVHRRDQLRAEKILQERLFKNPKIKVLWNQDVEAILGDENPKLVTGLKLKDTNTAAVTELELEGVFIAIGHRPMTDIVVDKLTLDKHGYVVCSPGTTHTNIPGVFAAGDVQDKIYRQAVTAAGQGCMAALDAERFLSEMDA
jgi:thioredoxin reductase (NADPH)